MDRVQSKESTRDSELIKEKIVITRDTISIEAGTYYLKQVI
ncbi:hypothetical protein [Cytobacillus firmus]|nr:hypothetical protein [Cytobacillus firmus]